jgi:threonine dehydrogenase-like Zn-dependent dehydrogenase
MKAIQYLAAGKPAVVDVPTPVPAPGQVLLRILGVTTCPQWDQHLMDGEAMLPGNPLVFPAPTGYPGHEAVGEVAAVGESVAGFPVGSRAALWRDQGRGREGCYAEYVVADVGNLLPVPDRLAPEQVAPLELAMCVQVSFDQILNIGAIAGRRFAVAGLGPAGLVAVQVAKIYRAAEIVVFDPIASRRELALELGADRAVDPLTGDVGDVGSVDLSIDCTGNRQAVELLLRQTRSVVALFGVLREDVRFGFANWCSGLHLLGYGQQNLGAAERALAHIVSGRLQLAPLVTHTLPLENYLDGVELLRRREAIKICFIP